MAHNWRQDSVPCHALRMVCCSVLAMAMLLDLRLRLASALLKNRIELKSLLIEIKCQIYCVLLSIVDVPNAVVNF